MPEPLHIAVAQTTPAKGDYAANLGRAGEILRQAVLLDPRPAVVLFPESALTGYFLEGGVRDLAMTAGALADDLARVYGAGPEIDVCIGFYEVWENTLYNSALYVSLGDDRPLIRHVHRKTFLPTYGLFDEERFVERGHEVRAFDTGWGRAAMLVCEDAWHSITGTVAALDGAQVLFVLAAAPARGMWPRGDDVPGPASVARWDRLVRDIAEEHGVFVALCNLAGSEGGKTFGGTSTVAGPRGDVRLRAPMFGEALLLVPCDLGDLTRARSDMPLLSDLRTVMPHIQANIDRVLARVEPDLAYDGGPGEENPAGPARVVVHAEPAAPSDRGRELHVVRATKTGLPPSLDLQPALVAEWLTHFVGDEVRRRGFDTAVIGMSGGVDSALTAAIAVRALGAANVIGVRLPYRTSSPDSLEHAALVMDSLGMQQRTIDISAAVDGYLAHEPDADATRRGNIMARVRMIALFDLSAKHRALPLGTGNKTERLFGYFTWHADDSPPINPLGDLFKTQVWALARHLGVPEAVIGKAPSADLVVGQTDERDFGISYAKADEILNWLLSGYATADLVARGFTEVEVELVQKRLAGTHWKRKLPTVAMLSSSAIGESYLRPVDF